MTNIHIRTTNGCLYFLDKETEKIINRIRKHPDRPIYLTVEPTATAEDIVRAIAVVERGSTDFPDK